MAATVLYTSMSLDGFIAGPNEAPDNGLGDGGDRLHEWFFAAGSRQLGGVNGQVAGESMAPGAVVAGRGTVEPAGYWGGAHHDGVPIFILTRSEPDSAAAQWPLVTHVNDPKPELRRRQRAGRDRNVLVH